MKGGISWDEAWSLSYSQRERIVKNLSDKVRKESGDMRQYM